MKYAFFAIVFLFTATTYCFAGAADATIAATAPQEYSSQNIAGDFDKSDARQYDKTQGPEWSESSLVGPGYAFPVDDASLEKEAKGLGVPQNVISDYVEEMKAMNMDYTAGGLTKTEYIQHKRELLSLLK